MTGVFEDDDDDLVMIAPTAIFQYSQKLMLCQKPISVINADSQVIICITGHLCVGHN
jgi:hypothetical protein